MSGYKYACIHPYSYMPDTYSHICLPKTYINTSHIYTHDFSISVISIFLEIRKSANSINVKSCMVVGRHVCFYVCVYVCKYIQMDGDGNRADPYSITTTPLRTKRPTVS